MQQRTGSVRVKENFSAIFVSEMRWVRAEVISCPDWFMKPNQSAGGPTASDRSGGQFHPTDRHVYSSRTRTILFFIHVSCPIAVLWATRGVRICAAIGSSDWVSS